MLFLLAIGAGAAVLEVHRALHHNVNGDVKELQEKEAALRKQLQDLQRDLRSAQQQRQLTEQEAAQLSAVNARLSAKNADLSATSSSLKAENEALAARANSLLEQQAALEAATESLKLENCTLLHQFDRLKIKYEQEASGFQEQLAELKSVVSGTLGRFTSGEISADQLMAFLAAIGVELRCRKKSLESLPDQLNSAPSSDERLKLLGRMEVEVGEGWMQQMRLVTAEPERTARLLMAGAAAARSAAAAALPDVPSEAAGTASASTSAPTMGTLVHAQPTKLPTPPKERLTIQLPHMPAIKVPPLKLSGVGSSSSGPCDENAAANAGAEAAAMVVPAADHAFNKDMKGRTMRFLPGKKALKKQAVPPAGPQLALDLPLSSRSNASALPRLPFDAIDDEMEMAGGSKKMMAL